MMNEMSNSNIYDELDRYLMIPIVNWISSS